MNAADRKELKQILGWIGVGVFGFVIFIFLLISAVTMCDRYVGYRRAVVKIEQLRQDVHKIDGKMAEDVIGQVTAWNMGIRAMQEQNRIPFFCWYIPNGWDDLEVIDIPQQKE